MAIRKMDSWRSWLSKEGCWWSRCGGMPAELQGDPLNMWAFGNCFYIKKTINFVCR